MTDVTGTFPAGRTINVTPEFAEYYATLSPEEQENLRNLARNNMLSTEYGGWADYINHPEIGPLLIKAHDEGWTFETLKREIRKTNWYNEHYADVRAFDIRRIEDSATVDREIEVQGQNIRQAASTLGGSLSDEQITELSTNSLRFGWTTQETTRAVALELAKGSDPDMVLRRGITGESVTRIAREMAIPMSDEAINEWTRKIAFGEALIEDFQTWSKQQAQSLYPTLAKDIERGFTVASIVDPYRQTAARTLGLSPNDVDFSDPKWNMALNFDDGKGRRNMTLFEWGEHLRRDERYGYDRTPSATGKAYSVVTDLGRMFGLTA
jgi:hypothetical protein